MVADRLPAKRRLSHRSTHLQAVRVAGLVVAVAAGFLAAQGEQWWGLVALVVVLVVTWGGGAVYFRAKERQHDEDLERQWQALATSQSWRFEHDYIQVGRDLRALLLGQGDYVRSEGSPYRLVGTAGTPSTRREMTVYLCLVRPPRMLLWGELPQRCTAITLRLPRPVPALGFGTHGRLFGDRPHVLTGVPHYRDRRTGYWIAGSADGDDRVREAFAPAITCTGRQQLRMVASENTLGLLVNRELTTEEILDWVSVLQQVAEQLHRMGEQPPAPSASGASGIGTGHTAAENPQN
ncbi:MAG TPA: hypothetical protein VK063_01960 [Beutenbergiaceae bacterium]|nr:hypothetical protein [Beutenbergiaceae bacterium]